MKKHWERLVAGLFVALLTVAGATGLMLSQDRDDAMAQARIGARPLADGRIEFGLQLAECRDDGIDLMEAEEVAPCELAWGERILPRVRKFPADPTVGNWYSSSPPILVGQVETRIRVRRLEDGRTEFAVQQRTGLGEWGEHVLPSSRFLSEAALTTHLGRWLNSSPVDLPSEVPPVSVSAGVPVVAEGILEWADLDGLTYNGSEPSFYYGIRQDQLDDSYYTWIVKATRTNDSLYGTLRLQLGCDSSGIWISLWEVDLPYQSFDYRVRASYRFDDGPVTTERWDHWSGNDDGFSPTDQAAFMEMMRQSDKLVIRASFYSRTITAIFTGVSQMFNTRVQPNIDYCGHY